MLENRLWLRHRRNNEPGFGKKATQLPEIASSGWPENLSSENAQTPKAETALIFPALPGKLGRESLSSARTALKLRQLRVAATSTRRSIGWREGD